MQNNNEHERWRTVKERRVYQVRGEIGEETKRSPLDPAALGLRYAEIEAICRAIDEREKQLVAVNRNALTEPQKMKSGALEAAMQLVQTGNQASLRFLIDYSPIGPVLIAPLGTAYDPTLRKERTGACAQPAGSAVPEVRVVLP